MNRVPIFSVHSIESESNSNMKLRGRALDSIRLDSKLFDSDSNYSVIEVIERENKCISELGIMFDGVITIRTEGQKFVLEEYLFGEMLEDYIQTITFDQAKQMAEESSRQDLSQFTDDPNMSYLHEIILEAECCWFFFYNPNIIIPEHKWSLRMLSAYAVSKKGEMRHTYNYLDDPVKLQDYLQAMSAHFRKKGI